MRQALMVAGAVLAVMVVLAGCEQAANGDGDGKPSIVGTWVADDAKWGTLTLNRDGTLHYRKDTGGVVEGEGSWGVSGDVLTYEITSLFGHVVRTQTISILTDTRLCLLDESGPEPETICYTRDQEGMN